MTQPLLRRERIHPSPPGVGKFRAMRLRIALLGRAWLALVLCALPGPRVEAQALTIRFFDVGQGDAALVTTPEGKTVLIDGGHWSDAAKWLSYLPVDTLDLVVGSHNHADHIGGFEYILQTGIAFRRYLYNGRPCGSGTCDTLFNLLTQDSVQVLIGSPRVIQVGSVMLRTLPIPPGAEKENDRSVGILLTYGAFSALFPGDAEAEEREYWERHAGLGPVTILKVAHHGSVNGTDAAWVNLLQPKAAIISVGKNSYKHPSRRTLSTLQKRGVAVYRTDQQGTITITADTTGAFSVEVSR